MPTEAKQATVSELTELLSGAGTTIVSDHRGLSVADLHRVRRELREKDISYRVVKNRLARIAAEQSGRPELIPLLVGPTALASVAATSRRSRRVCSTPPAVQGRDPRRCPGRSARSTRRPS